MASDYDEVRPDVKESQESSLEALRTENTPDARSVVKELDEADTVDGVDLPGDYIAEELIVEVVPPKKDEFVCSSCFLGPPPVPTGQGERRTRLLPRMRGIKQ